MEHFRVPDEQHIWRFNSIDKKTNMEKGINKAIPNFKNYIQKKLPNI